MKLSVKNTLWMFVTLIPVEKVPYDATSILLVYESEGKLYPNSINLHSIHHRPLLDGKVTVVAEIIQQGKNIATLRGEIYNSENKLATTLMHTVFLHKTNIKE